MSKGYKAALEYNYMKIKKRLLIKIFILFILSITLSTLVSIYLIPQGEISLFTSQLNGNQITYEILKKMYYKETFSMITFLSCILISIVLIIKPIKELFDIKSKLKALED